MFNTRKPASFPASRVAATCRSPKYAGTVITARVNGSPTRASASSFNRRNTSEDISVGVYSRPPMWTRTSPSLPSVTLYATLARAFWTNSSLNFRPMNRLTEYTVSSGYMMARALAAFPTNNSPLRPNPTTEDVRSLLSRLSIILGSPFQIWAMTELVVPRSIPKARAGIEFSLLTKYRCN